MPLCIYTPPPARAIPPNILAPGVDPQPWWFPRMRSPLPNGGPVAIRSTLSESSLRMTGKVSSRKRIPERAALFTVTGRCLLAEGTCVRIYPTRSTRSSKPNPPLRFRSPYWHGLPPDRKSTRRHSRTHTPTHVIPAPTLIIPTTTHVIPAPTHTCHSRTHPRHTRLTLIIPALAPAIPTPTSFPHPPTSFPRRRESTPAPSDAHS